jgi:hypothetical protein
LKVFTFWNMPCWTPLSVSIEPGAHLCCGA